MNKYLITLKPLGKYFFGSDMTFSVAGKDEHNKEFSSYIIESLKFPQQTSLLGMLRYLLLTKSPDVFSKEKNRIIDRDAAVDLIGKSGFSVRPGHHRVSFGKINSLGHCKLVKDGELYEPVPKDYGFTLDFSQKGVYTYNGKLIKVPEIPQYNPKDFSGVKYINLSTGAVISEDEIFAEDGRIGITKNHNGKSGEEGFYKQISYRLKDGFSFAFEADVDSDLTLCNSEIVSLGADGSRFSFSAELCTEGQTSMPSEAKKVVLCSNSFLIRNDLEDVIFQIASTVPLRFLKTSVETKKYNILSGEVTRSEKYHLYEKGSVFYFDSESAVDKFIEKLESKEEFRQIGYNIGVKF